MTDLAATFDALAQDAMARCTSCGKCAEACPTAREQGLSQDDPRGLVANLIALTRDPEAAGPANDWVTGCDASGQCSAACPEGINVRQWVSIARLNAQQARVDPAARKEEAARRFRAMSHAVRVLAAMQMPSAELARILAPIKGRKADVLFYTGCNVLKTAHIVFNVMDILDTLGIEADVVGGPSNCCGVYQFNAGDTAGYDKMGGRTFRNFGESGASRVLTWCPTCTKNFGEIEVDRAPPSFDLNHVSEFLAEQIEAMKPRFVDLPPRRAVLHEHQGIGHTLPAIRAMLAAVPNLTLVDLPQDSGFSYTCGGQAARYAERERAIHDAVAGGAVAAGADMVVTMYHSCHRALAGAEALYPFRVMNFTDVIAEALGRGGRTDYYKLYKTGGDMAQAVADARDYLESNGVKVSRETIDALTAEMFNEAGFAGDREVFRSALAGVAQ
ncbi:MAG: (Fe-S)-binding protein [Proteobacteria bacterium]|nr:(Fe-S)-binding protein [Pseudomonadota bacterium]